MGGAAPAVYGSFQARGRTGATAAGLHHSHCNTRSKPHVTYSSLQQYWILKPPRPWICPASSWTLYRILSMLSHNGNSQVSVFQSSEMVPRCSKVENHQMRAERGEKGAASWLQAFSPATPPSPKGRGWQTQLAAHAGIHGDIQVQCGLTGHI